VLVDALERLLVVVTAPRRFRPVEAPAHRTHAYARLIFAVAFARVGCEARAREIAAEARAGLADVVGDPVHDVLVAAFAARLEQAVDGVPRVWPLPGPLRSRIAGLDAVSRYKVERLRESSRTLESYEPSDALAMFSRRTAYVVREVEPWRAIDDPAALAAWIDERLGDGVAVAASLDAICRLPDALAGPLFDKAEPAIAVARAHVAALAVAGRFGWHDRARRQLACLAGSALSDDCAIVLRALRVLGFREEMIDVLGRLDDDDPTVAAALVFVGDPRGLAILDRHHETWLGTSTTLARLEGARRLVRAYGHGPVGFAVDRICLVAKRFLEVGDSFGTNTHFCVSALDFADVLAVGVAELVEVAV
jgi:hypothetical protein